MEFTHTISRTDLQALPKKFHDNAIRTYVEDLARIIMESAMNGKTSHTIQIASSGQYSNQYLSDCRGHSISAEDLVDGLLAKFPGCSVVLHDEWIDIRPGRREQRQQIVVDWS